MFTTAEDFNVHPYRLPNLDDDENFSEFVHEEEERRLIKILGRPLFDAFMDGLYSDVDDHTARAEEDIEQRWKDLRDGKEYTHSDGKTYYWEGMNAALRPYIFAQWTRYKTEINSGIGVVAPAAENAVVVGPHNMIVRAFNEFSEKIGDECRMEDTLYGYLFNSGETFTEDIGEEYGSIEEYLSMRFDRPGTMNHFNL